MCARAPLLLLLALVACGGPPAGETIHIDAMDLRLGASARPPDPADGRWRRVSLPDVWNLARRAQACEGWYAGRFSLLRAPEEPWAAWLPIATLNASVWANGVEVGNGGSFAPRLARNVGHPLYVPIPAPLLRAGENRIEVRLATTPGALGVLDAVTLGPRRVLEPVADLRNRVAWTEIALFESFSLLTGAFLLLLGLRGTARLGVVGWSAAGFLSWGVAGLYVAVRNPPLPDRDWEWLASVAFHGSIPFFVLALHRSLALRRPRLEAAVAIVWIAFALLYRLVPHLWALSIGVLWTAVAFALSVYVAALVVRAARRRVIEQPGPALALSLLGLLFAAHDVQYFATGWSVGTGLFGLFPLVAMLSFVWMMVAGTLTALRQAETLTRELETRVAEEHRALETEDERLRALEREREAAEERARILRDVADGAGGRLVSALARVEQTPERIEPVADGLRGALDDLRLVIDSLDPDAADLPMLLGALRARLEPRLAQRGVRFAWEMGDVPPLPAAGPRRLLEVLRAVQEAIADAARRPGTRTIALRAGRASGPEGADGVFVEVRGDARPEPPEARLWIPVGA